MKLLEQLFSKGLEIKDEDNVFRLKKQPTRTDYYDLSMLASKHPDAFIGEPRLQTQLAILAENIELHEYKGEAIDFEIEGFLAMKISVAQLFRIMREQLTELKKK